VVWAGHVSAPDPRLALIKAWVFFASESRDPNVSSPEGSGTRPRGLVCTCGGLEPRPEVRAVHPRLRHFPVVGSCVVRHVTKDSRVDTTHFYCSNGYPISRVLTETILQLHI
jgi:hypothetical protein